MDLDQLLNSVRYSLGAISILVATTGIVFLAVGIAVEKVFFDYYTFLTTDFFTLPAFLIATAVIIFLVVILGLFAAYNEHFYVILAFLGMMVILLIFEVSAAISGYVLRKNAGTLIQSSLTTYLPMYGNALNTEVTMLWDEVQRDFECCGILSGNDWLRSTVAAIPVSCCTPPSGTLTEFTCNMTFAYTTGCASALGEWSAVHALGIGITGIVISVVQAIALAATAWTARQSKLEVVEY